MGLRSNELSGGLSRPDATLYSLVHRILEAERERDIKERRVGRRHEYRCIQWVAPFGETSGAEKFQPVQCIDLSAAGLLYLSDDPPPAAELVVALGGETPIRLHAEVVREQRVVHQGRFRHRVACRFIGRAD